MFSLQEVQQTLLPEPATDPMDALTPINLLELEGGVRSHYPGG